VCCTGTDWALDGFEGTSELESESKGFVLWTGVPIEFCFLYIGTDISLLIHFKHCTDRQISAMEWKGKEKECIRIQENSHSIRW